MHPIGSGKHNFVSVTDIPQTAEKRVAVAGERDVSFAAWHRGARNGNNFRQLSPHAPAVVNDEHDIDWCVLVPNNTVSCGASSS